MMKDLINTIKDLGKMIHEQTIKVATFRSFMKVNQESLNKIQEMLNIETNNLDV